MKLTTHLSTPWGWKAELALLADLQRKFYPYKWLLISCRSDADQWKFADQRPTCHAMHLDGDIPLFRYFLCFQTMCSAQYQKYSLHTVSQKLPPFCFCICYNQVLANNSVKRELISIIFGTRSLEETLHQTVVNLSTSPEMSPHYLVKCRTSIHWL